MAHGTLGMLDAIVTFSDGADLDPTHHFLRLKHAQATQETHRTAKDSIRKRLLRRRNNNDDDFILVSMYLA